VREKLPYQGELRSAITEFASPEIAISEWRERLPVLTGTQVTLRELRVSDAASLLAMLSTKEVSRFISPPPTTIEGFERFVSWTRGQRAAGSHVSFGVTVKGFDAAIGIFQVRGLGDGVSTAEWGFAIGSPFWGTGAFTDAAGLVLEFTFETLGVHRVEARAAVRNGRGNGALLKIGAVQEAILRKSFLWRGAYLDQVLYGIIEDDWRATREPTGDRLTRISPRYAARVH
jgi:[ribosomal protein S5]-alanine N-acetyltransferase